jgi:hypothetical protein
LVLSRASDSGDNEIVSVIGYLSSYLTFEISVIVKTCEAPMPQLEKVMPVLMVRDVAAAIAFYGRIGFAEAFRDDPAAPKYAGVRRDGIELCVGRNGENVLFAASEVFDPM